MPESRDRREMADELRRAASHLHPHVQVFGVTSFGPFFHHWRGHAGQGHVRRHVHSGPALLVVPLLLLVLLAVMTRGAGFFFFGLPLLFVVLPFLLVRWFFRAHAMPSRMDREEEEPRPLAPKPEILGVDPRESRLRVACDRMLASLEGAPEMVRSFLTRPRETLEALRRVGLDLLARERELRETLLHEDEKQLEREATELRERIASEDDALTLARLQAALGALEHRRQMQAGIRRSANRLAAEQTRIIYTLEALNTQLLRVKSAGRASDPAETEGLRRSIEHLRDEIGALADALEDDRPFIAAARASPWERPRPNA